MKMKNLFSGGLLSLLFGLSAHAQSYDLAYRP